MPAFCIRPELADKLKTAAKAGDIAIEKMYTMSSAERRALFEKYVDKDTAHGVNGGFEKAMASEQQSAIGKWVQDTFNSVEKKKPEYKDVLKKVDELKEKGLLTPENETAFLEDLVAEKLGVTVTKDEAGTIAHLSDTIAKVQNDVSPVGTHTIEYYKAKRKMDNYVQSLTPASSLRVFTSTIGRGVMLTSIKSPLVNVVSNSMLGFVQLAERRILNRRFNGFNADVANEFRKYSTQVFKDTGYDLSRFQSFGGDRMITGEEITHSQGKGAVRAIGRFFEDTVFSKMMGLPDAAFASFHFTDSANLASSVLALSEGMTGKAAKERALVIMKDAFKEAPETKEGQYVRAQAEADALYATYTNDSLMSRLSLGMRGLVNQASGDFRLGDVTDPFVKTPANVIAAGLDYSGLTVTAKTADGILRSLYDVAHKKSFDKENFAGVSKYMVRAGLGMTFAWAVSQLIKPEDFIGQYPTSPNEQQLFKIRNGVENSIRVGDTWVSLDYLGVLGAPLLGFLYAKKYGNGGAIDAAYRYAQGVNTTLQNMPGIDTLTAAYEYIKKEPDKDTGVEDAASELQKNALETLTSRIIPGGVSDLANMTDTYRRTTDKADIFSAVKNQLPKIRKGSEISRTAFGDPQTTEQWVSTMLFGSRVKTAKDSQLINELVRLKADGNLPSLTDPSNKKQMADLRSQIGNDTFKQAKQYFGENLKTNMTKALTTEKYKKADSTLEQKSILDNVKAKTLKQTLDHYNYKKPPKDD
jgi:hypothetical protein